MQATIVLQVLCWLFSSYFAIVWQLKYSIWHTVYLMSPPNHGNSTSFDVTSTWFPVYSFSKLKICIISSNPVNFQLHYVLYIYLFVTLLRWFFSNNTIINNIMERKKVIAYSSKLLCLQGPIARLLIFSCEIVFFMAFTAMDTYSVIQFFYIQSWEPNLPTTLLFFSPQDMGATHITALKF